MSMDQTAAPRPTTQSTTTTPAPAGCENGEYYAVQGNCEEFSRCDQGILRYIRCSAGLHWNAELGACDWPQSANCQDTTSTTEATTATPVTQPVTTTQSITTTTSTTTTAATSTTEWAPTQQLPDSCENGQYFQRGPDCSEYQICVNGIFLEQKCAETLHWNMQTRTCDWPATAGCPFVSSKSIHQGSSYRLSHSCFSHYPLI